MTDVIIDDRDGVRTVTLDRPGSRNGLTLEVVRQLRDAVRDAPAPVRVIVMTGANGSFCSGLDLKDAMQRGPRPPGEVEQGLREDFHGLIRGLIESPRPTIAQVDGPAVGFGCDLAMACDFRVVSERAKFGEVFVKRGLMPDGGGTWLLPRLVGLGRALELLFTGDLVTAEDAVRIGLANRLIASADIAATTAELAATIAKGPPLVHKFVKQAVYAGLSSDVIAGLEREAVGQLTLLASKDFMEGVMAFLQKRDPQFKGE
ncbi:MAG: enoyl-CoA hydratase/isomerase family protein [Kofleriaceae bacterium]